MEKRHRVRASIPAKDLKGREDPHKQILALGHEWVEPKSRCPSPRVLCERDKCPCLLGELLGQIEKMEKSNLHSQSVYRCWLAN